ncbi:MAG: helix-turn-helix transcriptional regulator [Candidatus Dormibacteria bacterium]
MAESQVRLLRLIGHVQRRPGLSGPELARELGVTSRTLRRDVARLRRSGYSVAAQPGPGGGYRLGPGTLPPLPLDDTEARAVAVALSGSPRRGPAGIEAPEPGSLAKLDHLLPTPLRQRVATLRRATISLDRGRATVPTERLVALAEACQERQRVRFRYGSLDGRAGRREGEPHRLVATDEHWYLLCFDLDRSDWRTFRVDRIDEVERTGVGFVPRELDDPAAMVARAVTTAPYRFRVVVDVAAPAEAVAGVVSPSICMVEPNGEGCRLTFGADRIGWAAGFLVDLECPFWVREPEEVRRYLRQLGRTLVLAHPSGSPAGPHSSARRRGSR